MVAAVDIEFDPAKDRSNLRKHGVSFTHAEEALQGDMALTIEDPDARGGQRFITLGMETLGRNWWLFIRRAERPCASSARKASLGETEKYHA
ncbi:MAG: hypothetical protein B7Z79_08735 [Thiomonas sp. 20-64-9]|jgi:uncharacterized DUF497 family protein|nr:MAG: hypothetical protein B7Z79_08735 [Thiomonas sp. 20-64-9]